MKKLFLLQKKLLSFNIIHLFIFSLVIVETYGLHFFCDIGGIEEVCF
jgi:hypothetical protein